MLYKQQTMLRDVKVLVAHSKDLKKIKGETFNIYNILNLKTNEVRTHSAFLAELLNPHGSHLMGSVFLEAFLQLLPEHDFANHLDNKTAHAFVEYHIGLRDTINKTGGRIDILLKDGMGKTISIENKIDAGDQDQQIERYCNYNNPNNRVIYLSKEGTEPRDHSRGELQKDLDYHIIGYNSEIIAWLHSCQQLAYDQPLLRESIKQYRILIQQITNTLEDKEDKQLAEIIKNNLEEASLIASKYHLVIQKIKESFRDRVFELLNKELVGFHLDKQSIDKKYSNIWFHHPNLIKYNNVWFGAESFSGSGNIDGNLYVGIFDKEGNMPHRDDFMQISKWWVHHTRLVYDNQEINLSDTSFLNKISKPEVLEAAAMSVAKQIIDFIAAHRFLLEK
jgi:hypothetical protein